MKKIGMLCMTMSLLINSFSQKIGIGTTTPVFKLDVKGGSINTDSVYRIGGNTVLFIQGADNTFIGNTGNTTNTGSSNTATGKYALSSNTTGYSNTAIGRQSLYSNTTLHSSSFRILFPFKVYSN